MDDATPCGRRDPAPSRVPRALHTLGDIGGPHPRESHRCDSVLHRHPHLSTGKIGMIPAFWGDVDKECGQHCGQARDSEADPRDDAAGRCGSQRDRPRRRPPATHTPNGTGSTRFPQRNRQNDALWSRSPQIPHLLPPLLIPSRRSRQATSTRPRRPRRRITRTGAPTGRSSDLTPPSRTAYADCARLLESQGSL